MTGWWAGAPGAVVLLVALAEVTLVLLAAWGLDRCTMFHVRPRVRAGLWTLVLVRLLLPPGLLRWPGATFDLDQIAAATASSAAAGTWSAIPGTVLAAVWLIGAVVLAGLWIVRTRRSHRRLLPPGRNDAGALTARFDQVARRAGLARLPAVVVDPRATEPYVTGLWSPRLVLPSGWRGWPAQTLRHAVAHECAHLARRDLWMEAAWMAAVAIYWFHPLAHVARRRAYDAREMCCDADIARVIGPGYRSTLLRVVASAFDAESDGAAAPARHGWHPAIARLRALERWPAEEPRRHRVAGVAMLVLLACLVLPSHVAIVSRADAGVPIDRLIDPVSRQELGLGSLHLRYALIGAQLSPTSGDPSPASPIK